MEAIETTEQDGFSVALYWDEDPWSPADWDRFGALVTFPDGPARGYRGFESADSTTEDAAERGGAELLARYLRMTEGSEAVPFRFEDYGANGARIHASDDPNGYAYASRDAIVAEYGDDGPDARAKARELLTAELAEWDTYFQGDVYGYVVTGPDGEHRDSLWGLYGAEYARTEAAAALTDAIDYERTEAERIARVMAL